MNRLFRFRYFPRILRVCMLIAFGLLIWGGLMADTSSMSFAKTLRNTNLANLLVWSYWWPALIVATIFFGRVWCTVCPMELLTTLAAKVGLRRTPPALMRAGWFMTAFYVVILFVGIHTFAIHRVPLRMAIYMLVLLGAALITGLVYHRNTFCAHLCPVGHLLGLYARLAPFGWGVKSAEACAKCKDKSCVSEQNRYSLTAPSCQVGLYPPRVRDNTQCLLCGNCVKSCAAGSDGAPDRPNPAYRKRRFFQDILDMRPITPAHALFVTVVAGFVVYEILGEWKSSRTVLMYLPQQITRALSLSGTPIAGLIKATLLFGLFPLLFLGLPWLAHRLLRGRVGFPKYVTLFLITLIPIMAAAHLTKSLFKMSSRIPYLSRALSDPIGVETARLLRQKSITLPQLPSVTTPILTIIALALFTIALALSLHTARALMNREDAGSLVARIPLYGLPVLYGLLFMGTLFLWRLLHL